MPVSPQLGSEGAVRVSITSGGAPVAASAQVISVTVSRAVGEAPSARLVIADGDPARQAWALADAATFAPGADIVIRAGYGASEDVIFAGVVVGLGVSGGEAGVGRLVVDCRDVEVEAPRALGEASLAVTWGVDLLRFQADIDDHALEGPAPAVTWDPATQSLVRGAPAAPAPWAGLARVRGRMAFQGSAKAQVGGRITLNGVGDRFGGEVFVSGLTHEIGEGAWTTEALFGAPSAAVTDAVGEPAGGLHIGVVTDRRDPAGGHRIRIRIPLLDAEAEVWARLSQPQASAGFGVVVTPEVGDEVVVGFFQGDPADPVVLGSLYSPARAPPVGDDVIGFATRGGARVEVAEGGRTVTVTTQGNNRVTLNDDDGSVRLEDQHGNAVALGAKGIALVGAGDIDITARGALSLQAAGPITVATAGDVTLEGLNVACDAKASFAARGAAGAELSATGQTTVKGALVMIN